MKFGNNGLLGDFEISGFDSPFRTCVGRKWLTISFFSSLNRFPFDNRHTTIRVRGKDRLNMCGCECVEDIDSGPEKEKKTLVIIRKIEIRSENTLKILQAYNGLLSKNVESKTQQNHSQHY